jgi:hypothetical protein
MIASWHRPAAPAAAAHLGLRLPHPGVRVNGTVEVSASTWCSPRARPAIRRGGAGRRRVRRRAAWGGTARARGLPRGRRAGLPLPRRGSTPSAANRRWRRVALSPPPQPPARAGAAAAGPRVGPPRVSARRSNARAPSGAVAAAAGAAQRQRADRPGARALPPARRRRGATPAAETRAGGAPAVAWGEHRRLGGQNIRQTDCSAEGAAPAAGAPRAPAAPSPHPSLRAGAARRPLTACSGPRPRHEWARPGCWGRAALRAPGRSAAHSWAPVGPAAPSRASRLLSDGSAGRWGREAAVAAAAHALDSRVCRGSWRARLVVGRVLPCRGRGKLFVRRSARAVAGPNH